MSDVHVLAIDLAKRSFQVCATARGGACVLPAGLLGYPEAAFHELFCVQQTGWCAP